MGLYARGAYTQAVPKFRSAAAVYPERSDSTFMLGQTLFHLRDYEGAKKHYQAYLANTGAGSKPGDAGFANADALNGIGACLLEQHRASESVSFLSRAVQAKPTKPVFQHNLALACDASNYWNQAAEHPAEVIQLSHGVSVSWKRPMIREEQ